MKRLVAIGILLASAIAVCGQESPVAAKRARTAPEFLERATIYQIWMRSFTPEGTLQAVTARLPYIADLGATMVYLTPIQLASDDRRQEYWSHRAKQSKAGGATNPYRISDYDTIDPEYGTEADFRTLVATAHKLNLKVMMDVVFLHTGPDCVLMKNPEFYMHTPDGKVTLGRWNFPLLNFQSVKLREYLIGNLVHWARDVGVDGFRCDVAGGIPLDFWEQVRAALDKVSRDLVMLAEGDVPEHQLQAFDISYNIPYYAALAAVIRDGEPATRIKAQWDTARAAFPIGARFLHFSDNHDRDRADVVFGQKGVSATAVLNFTLDGVPFLYNGQEIGDTTPNDIMSHAPIRWDVGTFSAIAPKIRLYKRLFELRRRERALTSGELIWTGNSDQNSVVSYVRKKGGEAILIAVNLSNRKCSVTVDLPGSHNARLRDLINTKPSEYTASEGKVTLSLGAFDFVVAKYIPPDGTK
jgi:glycosidase